MKVSKRTVLKTVIGLLVAIALIRVFLYKLPYLKFLRFMKIEVKKEQQRKMRLLSETNHQALLEACRELSRRVSAGDLEPNDYSVRYKPHPETSRFPQQILDIEPTYVIINPDGRMMIELHGGFLHYGVWAYTEDYKAPSKGFEYGDKELIPRLWYYDDGYRDNPEYDKKIDALIQKGKMRRQAQQSQRND